MATPKDETVADPVARTRVLIVAKVRVHRELFAEGMTSRGSVDVVGALDPRESPNKLRATRAHVVVVDVSESDGSRNLRKVVAAVGDLPVIAAGVPPREDAVVDCAEAGVAGIVPEDAPLDALIVSAERAASADKPAATAIDEILLRRLRRAGLPAVDGLQDLTRRELQVLELIANDLSNKEIAETLHLAVPTVKNHVQSILKKLGVRRRTAAAEYLRQT
jgi:DNA-binding NarL/FixJ family response regulator